MGFLLRFSLLTSMCGRQAGVSKLIRNLRGTCVDLVRNCTYGIWKDSSGFVQICMDLLRSICKDLQKVKDL